MPASICTTKIWPRVTDNNGITTYGLMALGREMSTPPKLQQEYGTLYLLPFTYVVFQMMLATDDVGCC